MSRQGRSSASYVKRYPVYKAKLEARSYTHLYIPFHRILPPRPFAPPSLSFAPGCIRTRPVLI